MTSRNITLALTALLGVLTCLWLLTETSSHLWVTVVFGVIVPGLLLLGGIRKIRNWAQIIALAMICYATAGVMDVVASGGSFNFALGVAVVSIALFFSALDTARR